MARMVDADALAKAMGVRTYMEPGWTPATVWGVPIVEAEPVRHGHWKEDEARIKDQCSACGLSVNWSRFKTPYCPFCGAKMDVEDHE